MDIAGANADMTDRTREAWSRHADQFNQWENLSEEEREAFVAMFSAGWGAACDAANAAARKSRRKSLEA